jgi:YHS domain-containing protein
MIVGLTIMMCSGEKKQEATVEETAEEPTATTVADTSLAVCAGGCAMEMEKSKMISHEHEGETHYFCSEMCKENYLASKAEEKK